MGGSRNTSLYKQKCNALVKLKKKAEIGGQQESKNIHARSVSRKKRFRRGYRRSSANKNLKIITRKYFRRMNNGPKNFMRRKRK